METKNQLSKETYDQLIQDLAFSMRKAVESGSAKHYAEMNEQQRNELFECYIDYAEDFLNLFAIMEKIEIN